MNYGYPPDALRYDAKTETWTLCADFDAQAMMWQIEMPTDSAEEGWPALDDAGTEPPGVARLLDAGGVIHAEGALSGDVPLLLHSLGIGTIRLDRMEIDGVLALYVPSEALQPGRPYAERRPAIASHAPPSAEAIGAHSFLGAGTMIATNEGPQPIDWLRPGDMVLTRDNGYQPILHLTQATLPQNTPPAHLPLSVPGETFGTGLPTRDLILTGGSQILLAAPQLELWFGEAEMFASVTQIGPDLRARVSLVPPTLWSILFADPEVILVEGMWIGSALASPELLDLIPEELRARLSPIVTPRHKYAARACLHDVDIVLFERKRMKDAPVAAA